MLTWIRLVTREITVNIEDCIILSLRNDDALSLLLKSKPVDVVLMSGIKVDQFI